MKKILTISLIILGVLGITYIIFTNTSFIDENQLNGINDIPNPNIASINEKISTGSISIFLINPETNSLIKVTRSIPYEELSKEIYPYIFNELKNVTETYLCPIPKDCQLLSSKLEENLLTLNLSTEFINQNTANGNDKLILQSIVKTFTNLKEVRKVKINVDGKEDAILGQYDLNVMFSQSTLL